MVHGRDHLYENRFCNVFIVTDKEAECKMKFVEKRISHFYIVQQQKVRYNSSEGKKT